MTYDESKNRYLLNVPVLREQGYDDHLRWVP